MVSANEFFSNDPLPGQTVSAAEFGDFSTAQPQDEQEKLNFLERVGQDLKKRSDLAVEIDQAVQNGEQSYAEGVLQSAGKVGAGAVLDLLGEVIVSGGRGLSAITPDIIEDPIKAGATGAAVAFLNTSVGQTGLKAAQAGAEQWFEFKEEHPRAARNIESVINIGLIVTPAKGKPAVKSGPTVVGKAGEKITEKGVKQAAKQKASFVDDLVRPKQTAAVRTEQVGRTVEKGPLITKSVVPSSQEAEIAKAVTAIKDVSPKKTLQGNHSVISKEVSKEADDLIAALSKNDVVIPKKEFGAALDDALIRLGENPLLVGDAQKTAEKIISKMKNIAGQNKGSASGLLKSRKQLDAWVRSQKGPNIFDPKSENALSIALREVRQTTNDFIELKTPNVAVKQSLKKQSTLLRAMDNIAPKAADEAGNAALRLWQNSMRLLPVRGEFNQLMATAFGVGGLGASAMFAPFFTKLALGGIGTYAAGKVILGPTAKKALGKLLSVTDDAIRTTKDEALISQMRADRALIVELLTQLYT